MKILVASVGRPSLPHARQAVEDYACRISRIARPSTIELKPVAAGPPEKEGAALLAACPASFGIVPLDPRGRMLSSEEFARRLGEAIECGTAGIAFLIGGAGGHSEEARSRARWMLSLGPMTLQHELAQVVLLEQIYRAFTILKGHPYHRG